MGVLDIFQRFLWVGRSAWSRVKPGQAGKNVGVLRILSEGLLVGLDRFIRRAVSDESPAQTNQGDGIIGVFGDTFFEQGLSRRVGGIGINGQDGKAVPCLILPREVFVAFEGTLKGQTSRSLLAEGITGHTEVTLDFGFTGRRSRSLGEQGQE